MYPFTAALMIASNELREHALTALHQMPVRVLFGQTDSEDAKVFLQRFSDVKPDVVLLDAKLIPGSLEPFLRMMRELPAKPVVIALNSSQTPS